MRSFVRQLAIGASRASRRDGKANLGNDLIRSQSSRKQVHEEIIGLDRAPAARPLSDDIGLQRQHHARRIGRRIGVGDAAADGAAIAYLLVTDHDSTLRQQREMAAQEIGKLNCPIGRHGADGYRPIILADIG